MTGHCFDIFLGRPGEIINEVGIRCKLVGPRRLVEFFNRERGVVGLPRANRRGPRHNASLLASPPCQHFLMPFGGFFQGGTTEAVLSVCVLQLDEQKGDGRKL